VVGWGIKRRSALALADFEEFDNSADRHNSSSLSLNHTRIMLFDSESGLVFPVLSGVLS